MSDELNPYLAPKNPPGQNESVDRSEWTHSYEQRSLDLGEVGLAILPEELIIDVVKDNRRVRIPRARHFETLNIFRTFTRLKVSPPISLTLPAEILAEVRAWRGGSTREWLTHELTAGSKWLWVAVLLYGFIFFSEFSRGASGGLTVMNPVATAMIGLAFLLLLLRTALGPRTPHRLWFMVDFAGFLSFILFVVFDKGSKWWLVFVLVLFIPTMIGCLRRFKFHR